MSFEQKHVMLVRRGGAVWPAMVLAGLALGGYVYSVWPDTTTRIVRLPYGEAMPKTPGAKARPVRVIASVGLAEPRFVYELGPAPALDALTALPPPPVGVE